MLLGLAGADRRPFGAGLPRPRPIWRGPALALGAYGRPFGAGLPRPRPIWRGPALALGAYGRPMKLVTSFQTFACAKYSCVLVFDEAEPPHRKPWLWPRGHAGPGMGFGLASSGFWRKSGLLLLGKKISEVPLLEPPWKRKCPRSASGHRGTSY